ncbi:MAG: hypothetical protein HC912_07715 [Saprospiraceae bacterium]|nr:hypothetical protein [Saprospiraceae bacterium]
MLQDSAFLAGLNWGFPRYGHPEGKVVYHVHEVLANITLIPELSAANRARLRTIAYVHDTFKYLEDRGRPRDWSKHHAILAKNFVAQYTNDEAVLTITELHDEAYYIWRSIKLYQEQEKGLQHYQALMSKLGEHLQLYYLFFKCDTKTGDKIQAPLIWFEEEINNIEIVHF